MIEFDTQRRLAEIEHELKSLRVLERPVVSGGATPAPTARGDLLAANAVPAWSLLPLAGAAGSFLTRNATDPLWSTLTLPNAATQGDLLTATGANAIGRIADVAAGQPLLSGGIGLIPAYAGWTLAGTAGQTYTFSATGGTVPTGSGALNQVAYWSGVSTLTGDAGLTVDAANNGYLVANAGFVGNSSATARLHFDSSGATDYAYFSGCNVGVGTTAPQRLVDAVGTIIQSLQFLYRLQAGSGTAANQGPAIQFYVGNDALRTGKGAIGYIDDGITGWNRGDFYFMQSTSGDATAPVVSDAKMVIKNGGNVGIGTIAPDRLLHSEAADAVTNAVSYAARLTHICSTGATGLAAGGGVGMEFELETATDGTNQLAARIDALWIDATNATRKARLSLSAYDTAVREGLRIDADGSRAVSAFGGIVTTARVTSYVGSTTEALRLAYNASNYVSFEVAAGSALTVTTTGGASGDATFSLGTDTVSAVSRGFHVLARCIGDHTLITSGYGVRISTQLEDDGGNYVPALYIDSSWTDAVHATRKSRTIFYAWDTTAHETLRFEADGVAARLSFYGGTAVVRGAALTAQLTTLTYTAPGVPDYAIQDFAQNGGAGIWGFVSHDEANSVLKVIANLQIRVAELEARLGSATGVNLFA